MKTLADITGHMPAPSSGGESVLRFEELGIDETDGKPAVHALNFQLRAGERVAVVTDSERAARRITRTATGLVAPARGRVLLLDHDLERLGEREKLALRQQVGMLFHNSGMIFNLTVWYNVALPALYHSRFHDTEGVSEQISLLLDRCGIHHLARLRPAELNDLERKRVALARAWSLQPPLLIFEDLLVDIDPAAAGKLMDLAFGPSPPRWQGRDTRPREAAVLLTARGLHETFFRYLDRLVILEQGELVFDGDPKGFDRRGKSGVADLLNEKDASGS